MKVSPFLSDLWYITTQETEDPIVYPHAFGAEVILYTVQVLLHPEQCKCHSDGYHWKMLRNKCHCLIGCVPLLGLSALWANEELLPS